MVLDRRGRRGRVLARIPRLKLACLSLPLENDSVRRNTVLVFENGVRSHEMSLGRRLGRQCVDGGGGLEAMALYIVIAVMPILALYLQWKDGHVGFGNTLVGMQLPRSLWFSTFGLRRNRRGPRPRAQRRDRERLRRVLCGDMDHATFRSLHRGAWTGLQLRGPPARALGADRSTTADTVRASLTIAGHGRRRTSSLLALVSLDAGLRVLRRRSSRALQRRLLLSAIDEHQKTARSNQSWSSSRSVGKPRPDRRRRRACVGLRRRTQKARLIGPVSVAQNMSGYPVSRRSHHAAVRFGPSGARNPGGAGSRRAKRSSSVCSMTAPLAPLSVRVVGSRASVNAGLLQIGEVRAVVDVERYSTNH